MDRGHALLCLSFATRVGGVTSVHPHACPSRRRLHDNGLGFKAKWLLRAARLKAAVCRRSLELDALPSWTLVPISKSRLLQGAFIGLLKYPRGVS